MTAAERKRRREAIVSDMLPGMMGDVHIYSEQNPDYPVALRRQIKRAFVIADEVIAESDRREKDGR